MAEYQSAPFLKQARGKDPDDRNLFEKIAVGIYGKEDTSLQLGNDLILDESYDDIIKKLPGDIQDDVARYKNIFKETPIVLENFLNEYKDKGFSDYIEKGTFYKDGIKLAKKDQLRYQDYGFLGKGSYDQGSKNLYALMKNVRKLKTGNTQQPEELTLGLNQLMSA